MERHRALAVGLAGGGLGHLYYSPFVLGTSAFGAFLTAVTGLALLQAAAAAHARDAWGVGVSVATAAAATLPNLQDLLVGALSVWSVGGTLETLGLAGLAAALVSWGLAGSPGNPAPRRLDRDRSVLALRAACGVSAASSLVYGAANVALGNTLLLPGNALVVGGFGLAAWGARAPLFTPRRDPQPAELGPAHRSLPGEPPAPGEEGSPHASARDEAGEGETVERKPGEGGRPA